MLKSNLLSAVFLLIVSPAMSAKQPNIIFMLSDDQAWSGLSVRMDPDNPLSASPYDETPHLENLATQGMRLTNAYAPSPVCSPTRASIQTGKTPASLNWTKAASTFTAEDGFKLIPPDHSRSLSSSEITLGESLKGVGYRTAHFGKWHLLGGGPERHGFDVSDGDTGNSEAVLHKAPNPVDLFGMVERSILFIKASQEIEKPFFVQLSFNALHAPENALTQTLRKYREKLGPKANVRQVARAAINENMDSAIGLLMETLANLGLEDETYVFFMSDNGAGGRNGVLRGGKGGLWEGGIRVPLIVKGPGIAKNSFSKVPVIGYDLLPTFLEIAGITAVQEDVEGGSMLDVLQGKGSDIYRSTPGLIFHFPHYQGDATPQSAIIREEWKVIRYYDGKRKKLFNLKNDPGEINDMVQTMPQLAAKLTDNLDSYLAQVGANLPRTNPLFNSNSVVPKR